MKNSSRDLFRLLKKEHKEVKFLIEEALNADPEDRMAFMDEIEGLLVPHARGEEKTVYASMLEMSAPPDQIQSIVRESYEDHRLVDSLLSELKNLSPSQESWISKLKEIKTAVESHAKEEENVFFPMVKECLTKVQIVSLFDAYEDSRDHYRDSLPKQTQISARKMSREAREAIHL